MKIAPPNPKKTRRRKVEVRVPPIPPMDQARRLNLEADIELQRGHHAAAERLALRAAELRGWA